MAIRTKDALEWMVGKAHSAAGIRNNLLANGDRASDSVEIGKLYFYWYDPKLKNILPIYDRFPLVMPMERYVDGWLGLNFHYLPEGARNILFQELLAYKNNRYMDERTKIRASYALLSQTKTLNIAKPAIKKYLTQQVVSKFVEVTPAEWDKAAALPVASFVRKP